jgi:hypothetical protein
MDSKQFIMKKFSTFSSSFLCLVNDAIAQGAAKVIFLELRDPGLVFIK